MKRSILQVQRERGKGEGRAGKGIESLRPSKVRSRESLK
jgi:hypothetical protein